MQHPGEDTMSETSGGEKSDQQITNQLASLVPSFDPSKDDMQTYKQKVEIVLGAWPKTRITELTTRLILNTQGSAFQTLQLHHAELMANEEKSVTRLVELLGGQWGRIGLEQQYQDVENALYHTTQRADESHDSFLARADVLWSKAVARKLSLSDLQAFVTLRGSLLAPEEKKRVILDADQSLEGKLTVPRVREAIRLLGATFFAAMTGQKTTARTKVYDATTMHVEHQDEVNLADGMIAMDDVGTEEDFIEALVMEGEDEDAVLVADFEALAADTIQEDSELAQAFNAYSDARRRLSEKFRNRGFWPTSKGPSHAKGKGFGGKFSGQRGKEGYNPSRQRRSLQDRIMQSNCRACGRKGHWKAECPFKSSAPSTTSPATSTAPTSTMIIEQDALPMEFLNLPQLPTEASCPIPEEPKPDDTHNGDVCFFLHGVGNPDSTARMRLRDSLKHYRDRIHNESGVSNETHAMTNSRHRVKAWIRRSKTLLSPCEPLSRFPNACSLRPGNAEVNDHQQPVDMSCKTPTHAPKEPEAQVCFATHGTMAILDSGASKTVVGSNQLSSLLQNFEPSLRSQLRRSPCSITFRFGNQGTLQSKEALIVPLGPLQLRIAIVPGETPFLLSNTLLRALQAKVDCVGHVLESPLLAQPVRLQLSSKGLFMVDLNELAAQACQVLQDQRVPKRLATPTETFVSEGQEKKQATAGSRHHVMNSHARVDNQVPGLGQIRMSVPASEVPGVEQVSPSTSAAEVQQQSHESQNEPAEIQVQETTTTVTQTNALGDHGNVHLGPKAKLPSDASAGGSRRSEPLELGRALSGDTELRSEACWQNLCRSMDGPGVGEIHGHQILPEYQKCPPQVPSVCGVDAGPARTTTDRDSSDSYRQRACGAAAAHGQGQDSRQSQGQGNGISHSSVPPRHGGRMGYGTRPVSIFDYDLKLNADGSVCTATTNAEHGECHDADHASSGKSSQCSASAGGNLLRSRLSEDWSAEINTMISQDNHALKHLILSFESELQQAIQGNQPIGKPCALVEVFCSANSPLTHQMLQQHETAYRFGYAQGDLASSEGRAKLFGLIARHRPTDIWVSPDCGPWSSWSQLNASRSLEHQHHYEQVRKELLYQIAICIVLFRHQLENHQHFHWEQPAKSLMFVHPGLAEVHQHTYACQFDMCTAGNLRDPQNGLFMKKGMTILTTRKHVYLHLHGMTCKHQHVHQPMEGSFMTAQGSMLRTKFSAIYPRKFARTVVRLLRQDDTSAFAVLARRQRPTFVRSELVTPESRTEQEAKRRRLDGKQSCPPCLEQFQELMKSVDNQLKRVGKQEIVHPPTCQMIQDLLPDKTIVRVLACRGTDRTIGPPTDLLGDEAPFRRTIMLHRGSQDIKFERYWERWTSLSNRQLVRPAHPCRINITVFAKDPTASASSSSSLPENVPMPQSQVSPAEMHENPPFSESDRPASDTTTEVKAPDHETPVDQMQTRLMDQTFRFRSLPKWEQQQIIHMHKNLGHPSNDRLSRALQTAGYRPDVSQAALELKCQVCAKCSPPKHQRPATLKTMLDFNHRIYIDGVNWTNSQGKSLQFYHIVDAGSNFHVAIATPAKTTQDILNIISQHWMSWAGPPTELQVDSGTELNSEEFAAFLQRFGIKGSTTCPMAHWQNGKVERHGKFLQHMLTKIDLEHPIHDYQALQLALSQSTHAKNSLSIRHGYAPEIIVFGKHSRIPGSILSDESIPSHEMASQEDHHVGVLEFKNLLKIRESARKAFHDADNNDSLRRAILRKACPHRGMYEKGQWVMIWRGEPPQKSGWFGPQRVIIQDGHHTVWTTQCAKLYRSAPEHVRPVLSQEMPECPDAWPDNLTELGQQITNINNRRSLGPISEMVEIPSENSHEHNPDNQIHHDNHNLPDPEVTSEDHNGTPNSPQSLPQPDQEPDLSRQGSVMPEVMDHPEQSSITDALTCVDVDWCLSAVESQDAAWRCEFDVPLSDHQGLPENQEEAWTLLATNAKKQRSEVRLTELSPEEKAEFQKAKMAEVQSWVQTGTVSKVLRNQIPEDQILRCRWILTWKPLDNLGDEHGNVSQRPVKTHKAKARLVVLGYLDPNLEEIPRDSPTLNRTSRMILLQVIASCGWQLQSFDVKAAFLQGQPQSDRIMAVDPVPELRQIMNLGPQHVAKLNKSAYGLVDAPFLWFCSLVTELTKLGFEASPFDPCLFVLREPATSSQAGKIAGILGVHVDDGIGGGNALYEEKIKELEKKFKFGSHKTNAFTFTGVEVTQRGDNSIHLSQGQYIKKINPISLDCNRKTQHESLVTEKERLALRGIVGSLQYAATNTRPDIASKLSFLQSSINTAKVETLHEANRLLHEAKKHHDVAIVIKPIPVEDFRFMAFSDASFSSAKKPDSHAGLIIVGTHKDVALNKQCPISPISWVAKRFNVL